MSTTIINSSNADVLGKLEIAIADLDYLVRKDVYFTDEEIVRINHLEFTLSVIYESLLRDREV